MSLLPEEYLEIGPAKVAKPAEPFMAQTMQFEASLVADLVHARNFTNEGAWRRCVGVYSGPWLGGADEGAAFAEKVREHFHAIEKVSKHTVRLKACSDSVS